MAQRCTYCGRARKNHKKPCVDVEGFIKALGKDTAAMSTPTKTEDYDLGWADCRKREVEPLREENTRLREALRHIATLWPEPPNCADVLAVNGVNDGKGRAILLQAALDLSRSALAAGKGEK